MDDNAKKALGEKIKQKREGLGLSQLELAKSAHKQSPAYIAFIEAGERNISAMDLMLIAKRLGTSVAQLLGENEKKSADWMQALRGDKTVSSSDKKKMEDYYDLLKKAKDHDSNK